MSPRSTRATQPPPPPPLTRAERWSLLLVRVAAILAGAVFCSRLPLPVLEEWLPLKNVAVAVAAVVLTGRALYDTFFYDRFLP